MTDTTLLYDGPDLRIRRHECESGASLEIVKLGTPESIQLTREQLKEIWPQLSGFVASSEEGEYGS